MVGVMGGNGVAVIGNRKVNLKDAVTELIVEKEGFAGISVGIAKDTAESMRNVGMIFGPAIIKVVRWLRARNIVDCSWCDDIPLMVIENDRTKNDGG